MSSHQGSKGYRCMHPHGTSSKCVLVAPLPVIVKCDCAPLPVMVRCDCIPLSVMVRCNCVCLPLMVSCLQHLHG